MKATIDNSIFWLPTGRRFGGIRRWIMANFFNKKYKKWFCWFFFDLLSNGEHFIFYNDLFDEFFSHTIIGFGLWIVITSNLYYYYFLSPKNCRDSKPEPDAFMKGWHRFITINDKIMSFSINLKILIGVVFVPNHHLWIK